MKHSAGILAWREHNGHKEVFLVHPGGPLNAGKDDGFWGIPKGEIELYEDALEAAKREFTEETSVALPDAEFVPIDPFQQSTYKTIHAFIVKFDFDASSIVSNTFPMEWPPHSGNIQYFPEVDRGSWYSIGEARRKMLRGQQCLLDYI